MHCYVVDDCMNPTPAGVPGELLLSGPRLAAGYIGRPDLTADRFIDNPCYADVEASLPPELRPYFLKAYRTGARKKKQAFSVLGCIGLADLTERLMPLHQHHLLHAVRHSLRYFSPLGANPCPLCR